MQLTILITGGTASSWDTWITTWQIQGEIQGENRRIVQNIEMFIQVVARIVLSTPSKSNKHHRRIELLLEMVCLFGIGLCSADELRFSYLQIHFNLRH